MQNADYPQPDELLKSLFHRLLVMPQDEQAEWAERFIEELEEKPGAASVVSESEAERLWAALLNSPESVRFIEQAGDRAQKNYDAGHYYTVDGFFENSGLESQ